MSSDVYRRGYNDICKGYSFGRVLNRPTYIKHLTHEDQLDLDSVEKDFYERARSRGLPTEEMRLTQLKDEGLWKDSDDKELSDLKLSIDSLRAGRKNASLPSILSRINQQIEEEETKYSKKLRFKNELVALTCEKYSQKMLNEYYIFKNLFSDKFFEASLFTEEEFEEISEIDMVKIIEAYNSIMEPCSDANIKKLAIQDFFQSAYYICDNNFSNFFGKPICKFSLYQIKLANYAKYFRTIFENHDMRNAPKEILEDPDKIGDWVNATEKARAEMEKNKDAAMSGMAGMTKQDRKALGVQKDGVDLSKEAAKHGGSLNKEQLMRLMGGGQR